MPPSKPIRLLLAVPAACMLLFLGLDIWYGTEAHRLSSDPTTSDVCSTNPLSRAVRDRCDSQSRAAFAACASAALLALLAAAYLAVSGLTTSGLVGSNFVPDWMSVGLPHRPRLFRSGVDHFDVGAIPDGVIADIPAVLGTLLGRV
jgi:hypothetical protein